MLPDGKVLVVERGGAIKLYDPEKDTLKTVNTLPVFNGLEDGLLGIAKDPGFAQNGWIYLFYSPPGDKPMQRISRFLFAENALVLSSEKALLEIPTQREECCHSAGSLAFGPDGNLFIAVGDNTNPHNPGYYNSIDERPGRKYWDAQRTAANTNDLRGKILRIKPEENGTYSIPEGNLFPKDGAQGLPEIYAMGSRNPFRLAVDPRTGWLMWGDVGQNTIDDPSRGPISYDEWHLAKEPGFYGWPYFAGPNAAYTDFDFTTEKNGPFFDPKKPVNASPNNTGVRNLPPAKPALIWYSYDASNEFEHLGTGGKSPIAGPVYYADLYPSPTMPGDRKFPDYYHGKWFIAEWMRDWINVITLDETGKLTGIEPFLPEFTFNHPIDLAFGPDGALYVLEYGTFWFSQNKDSGLARIEYAAGNRKPVVAAQADVTAGAAPLTVHFSSEGTFDHDKEDQLAFSWNFGTGIEGSTERDPVITFESPGLYTATLHVKDPKGATAEKAVKIQVGNSRPEISLEIEGNRSFFWDKRKISYQLRVKDKEDGMLNAGIDADAVSFYAVNGNPDGQSASAGIQSAGMELILNSDCRSCHALKEQSVGPSYHMVAQRYAADPDTINQLAKKVIEGGSGKWGERVMSAHPQLTLEQATNMITYILSLDQVKEEKLPLKGEYVFNHSADKQVPESYVFKATYTDSGNPPAGPLKEEKSWTFRPLRLKAIACDDYYRCNLSAQTETVRFSEDSTFIVFKNLDLTKVKKLTLRIGSAGVHGRIEVRMGKPDGELVGQAELDPAQSGEKSESGTWAEVAVPLENNSMVTDVYFVYRDVGAKAQLFNTFDLDWVSFHL